MRGGKAHENKRLILGQYGNVVGDAGDLEPSQSEILERAGQLRVLDFFALIVLEIICSTVVEFTQRTMKLYRVILDDRREEEVVADSYSRIEGELHFFVGGRPVPDIFFKDEFVKAVTVVSDDYERDSKPGRYRLR